MIKVCSMCSGMSIEDLKAALLGREIEDTCIGECASEFTAYVVRNGEMKEFTLKMGELTDDEREIILAGCLINYNRNKNK